MFFKVKSSRISSSFRQNICPGNMVDSSPKNRHNLWWECIAIDRLGPPFHRSSLVFIIICPSWQLKKKTMSFGRAEPFNCEDDRSVGYFISCLSGHIRSWCYYLYALYSVLMWKIKIIIDREILFTDIGN